MEATTALIALMFAVDLDGRPLGTHDFHIERDADGRETVRSNASFTARVLGVPLYRYRHETVEQWARGCVQTLDAATDDDGHRTHVSARAENGALAVTGPEGSRSVPGCVRTFAYWDPARLAVPSLLDPQSGRLEPARLEEVGRETLIRLDGRAVDTRRLRLTAAKLVIDLWYDAAGEWLQLMSTTTEGRHLRYRRKADAPRATAQ